MKIAMFTNTYLPHVGGVARSVATLEHACRDLGHEVRVIAPEFDGAPDSPDVLRVPAIQNFNGSDFCVRLPMPALIRDFIGDFQPDVIHSHHPFLLGDAAMRESWKLDVPLVFTHHTLYERYTHYVPLDSPALRRMAIQLATEYCNLCDVVIAPSDSIANLLKERSVRVPIRSIPTGIDIHSFSNGDGRAFREKHAIPDSAMVFGHVGRLAKEKNLDYLAAALAPCLANHPEAVFLLIGDGPAREGMVEPLVQAGGASRVVAPGKLSGPDLADAYAAMDCFVFASQTETQGIVLAEAMAAGKPVVALDGPGVREIVRDGENGILLPAKAPAADFTRALAGMMARDAGGFADNARATAAQYATEQCASEVIATYRELVENHERSQEPDTRPWDRLIESIEVEWELLAAKVSALAAGVNEKPATEARLD